MIAPPPGAPDGPRGALALLPDVGEPDALPGGSAMRCGVFAGPAAFVVDSRDVRGASRVQAHYDGEQRQEHDQHVGLGVHGRFSLLRWDAVSRTSGRQLALPRLLRPRLGEYR